MHIPSRPAGAYSSVICGYRVDGRTPALVRKLPHGGFPRSASSQVCMGRCFPGGEDSSMRLVEDQVYQKVAWHFSGIKLPPCQVQRLASFYSNIGDKTQPFLQCVKQFFGRPLLPRRSFSSSVMLRIVAQLVRRIRTLIQTAMLFTPSSTVTAVGQSRPSIVYRMPTSSSGILMFWTIA